MKRNRIIDDLLTLRPTGPKGTVTYTPEKYFCYEAYKDKTRWNASHSTFEYEDLVLFDLNLHTEEDVRAYMRDRFYDRRCNDELTRGQRGGLSRKVNRVWERLHPSIRRIQTVGSKGIYRVALGWSEVVGHLYAGDMEEAKSVAKLLFRYVAGEDSPHFRVTYVRHGGVVEMLELNKKLVEKTKESIEGCEKRAKQQLERAENMRTRIKALVLVEQHQLQAECNSEQAVV